MRKLDENGNEITTVTVGYGEITSHAISLLLIELEAHGNISLLERMGALQRLDTLMVEMFRGKTLLTKQRDGSYIETKVEEFKRPFQKEPTHGKA